MPLRNQRVDNKLCAESIIATRPLLLDVDLRPVLLYDLADGVLAIEALCAFKFTAARA